MSTVRKLNKLLQSQSAISSENDIDKLLDYAENIAGFENLISVVSDLRNGTSRIFTGKLGILFGISTYKAENSIWEKAILDLMPENEREEKYLAELRFFNFLRHIPRRSRPDYHMESKLQMKTVTGEIINMTHRMYYIYDTDSDKITHALCLYGRRVFDYPGRSVAVNAITGVSKELTPDGDISILSKREQQVLKLIDSGNTSADIAEILSISKNTVSRHRQEILAKLQARNSVEACKTAKSMNII